MKYIYLTKEFYNDYRHCKEILKKPSRPYVQVFVEINNYIFAIPLRSHITHKYVIWTDKTNCCGLDLSKTVLVIKPDKYIDCSSPIIRQNEYDALRGQEHNVKTKLISYIKKYIKAKKKLQFKENRDLCNYSSLQYFEEHILTMFNDCDKVNMG